MKTVRWILGRIILLIEKITMPKGVARDDKSQNEINVRTSKYSLYQFEACPFCVKVRKTINTHSLAIEYRDAKNDNFHRNELAEQGGKIKVPCLRIANVENGDKWLYESDNIIEHLEDFVTNLDKIATT